MHTAHIPMNDLQRHARAIQSDLRKAFEDVLASGRFILGPQVERFESEFAAYCGVSHAVSVANGTDALELALLAADCGPGDDVVTVANAGGFATLAIGRTGARPVYADIDPDTLLMTPDSFLKAATSASKAVIVTHLYGLMTNMHDLREVAKTRGIVVIEDAAQAHGAVLQGKKAGAWGALACFSFYPTKNLGALGDAGCVVTNDDSLAARLRSLRHYGWQGNRYHMHAFGRNSRMDELQAAVLSCMLPHLDGWNAKRRSVIRRYRESLESHGILFQQRCPDGAHAGYLCVVRVHKRKELMDMLSKQGIATDIHYPVADYAQPAVICRFGSQPGLPVTERVLPTILSLPCFPEMTEEEVERVITAVADHCTSRIAS